MTLNNVVFPAPLGPISPVISPGSTPMLTSSTATLPPKRTVTSCASSRATRTPFATRFRC